MTTGSTRSANAGNLIGELGVTAPVDATSGASGLTSGGNVGGIGTGGGDIVFGGKNSIPTWAWGLAAVAAAYLVWKLKKKGA